MIDVPAINQGACQMVQRRNFQAVFETERMYTQANPIIESAKIFGITTFELG